MAVGVAAVVTVGVAAVVAVDVTAVVGVDAVGVAAVVVGVAAVGVDAAAAVVAVAATGVVAMVTGFCVLPANMADTWSVCAAAGNVTAREAGRSARSACVMKGDMAPLLGFCACRWAEAWVNADARGVVVLTCRCERGVATGELLALRRRISCTS